MRRNFRKNESGYIVVETVGSFMLFVLLVVSILSLVNIVTLQSRVHYALTQSAIALSIYGHILEATGQAEKIQALILLQAKHDKVQKHYSLKSILF